MRISLSDGSQRGLFLKILLGFVERYLGEIPGPMLFFSYRPGILDRGVMNYMQRSTSSRGRYKKEESELFAAFVSRLNSCDF